MNKTHNKHFSRESRVLTFSSLVTWYMEILLGSLTECVDIWWCEHFPLPGCLSLFFVRIFLPKTHPRYRLKHFISFHIYINVHIILYNIFYDSSINLSRALDALILVLSVLINPVLIVASNPPSLSILTKS